MEIVGLIAISCVLFCLDGGLAGVIILWCCVLFKALDKQKRIQRYEQMKRDFKKKHGYSWPMR